MLLDIDHFYGQSEGRLGPWLTVLGLSGFPLIIFFYYFYGYVPLKYFLILWIPFTIKVILVFPGREKERKKNFYKIKNDSYESTAEHSNVKKFHDDGCIEYLNGRVAYNIVTYNGTIMDDIVWTQRVAGLLEKFKDFDLDLRVHNIQETGTLEKRYENVKIFNRGQYAQDYIDIIDHNRKLVYTASMLLRLTITVSASKLYYKELRNAVQDAVNSYNGKAFKTIVLADAAIDEELCSRDIGGHLDIEELLERKYYTGEYFGSKVVGIDDSDLKERIKVEETDTTVFIPR